MSSFQTRGLIHLLDELKEISAVGRKKRLSSGLLALRRMQVERAMAQLLSGATGQSAMEKRNGLPLRAVLATQASK